MKKAIVLLLFLLLNKTIFAIKLDSFINLSAYIDVFYSYDFGKPSSNQKQLFLYNYNRHNEFSVNLAFLKLNYEHQGIRGNIALQAGTYGVDNYANEKAVWRNLLEANIGVALDKKAKLWLDAGILPSYLGLESAIASEQINASRSLAAENSPYFLSGIYLTFQPNEQWMMRAVVCNGWQRISRIVGNSLPSFGLQGQYFFKKFSFNYGNYFGSENPDSSRAMRFFNNAYIQYKNSNYQFALGIDYGVQHGVNNNLEWMTCYAMANKKLGAKLQLGSRFEYYNDPSNIIIQYSNLSPISLYGLSLNLDYKKSDKMLFRIEIRALNNSTNIFKQADGTVGKQNISLLTTAILKLD